MSSKAKFLFALAASTILVAGSGYAFNLPKVPGAPASAQATAPASGAPASTGASVTHDAQLALVSFASSQLGLAKALDEHLAVRIA